MIRLVSFAAALLLATTGHAQKLERHFEGDQSFPFAVTVDNACLLHTGQILPWKKGKIAPLGEQHQQVLDNLEELLAAAGSSPGRVVRLNIHSDGQMRTTMMAEIVRRAKNKRTLLPTLTFLSGSVPHPEASVAIDAVAVARPVDKVELVEAAGTVGSILPPRPTAFISGQAEKGATTVEATRKTLESLHATLKWMGLDKSHVAQCRSFLTPWPDREAVVKEFEEFFGKGKVPPLVFVEWQMNTPIEIEMVVHAPAPKRKAWDEVDYLTPPGMTASPVYCRVARVHADRMIYFGSIASTQVGDGKAEVESVFTQLGDRLKKTVSDFRHLVKATYFVSNEDASKQLNALRPNFYDPRRPPAASKAMVKDVGFPDRHLNIDMIAVPSSLRAEGPPEVGHGLTPKMVEEGWISLFDGKTTFGWEGAKVANGVLSGGRTTLSFGKFQLKAEIAEVGVLIVGDMITNVEKGAAITVVCEGTGRIALNKGAAVRSLMIRPLDLASIMPGPDLSGWKRIDRANIPEDKRPTWKMKDGVLEVVGGPGALEWPHPMANMILQVQARSLNRHANGGVFLRSIPGDFMNGYEAQIHSACVKGDPAKPAEYATGGIDDRQNARRLVSRDFEPFVMTIIADGPRLATWVNGHQVTDWTDDRKPDPNPRRGLRLEAGTIQLQAHDPATHLEFQAIRVRTLPDTKPMPK